MSSEIAATPAASSTTTTTSSAATATARRTAGPLSRKNKAGIVLAALSGVFDLASPFTTPSPAPGAEGPPMGVLWVDALLGLIAVAAAVYTWRTANRIGSRVIAGSRILAMITALPAFFVGGVPAGLVALAAGGVVVTIVVVGLVLSRPAESVQSQ